MTKKTWTMLAAICAVMALSVGAWADSNPGNNSGSFEVRITPNVDYGVTVDTLGAAWEGDTDLYTDMDMNTSKKLQTGVKVTIQGDWQNQEVSLSGLGLDTWTLDTDESAEEDQLRLYGMLGADQAASIPTAVEYTAAGDLNLIDAALSRAGQAQVDEAGDSTHIHEFLIGAGAHYDDVDGMTVGTIRRLWLRADVPPTTTTDGMQRFTVTVTAGTGVAL